MKLKSKILFRLVENRIEKDPEFFSEVLNYVTDDCPYEERCWQNFYENCDMFDECVQARR